MFTQVRILMLSVSILTEWLQLLALELHYVEFLCENDYLIGDEAIDTHQWAEERREALELRNKQREVTIPRNDQQVMGKLVSMLDLLTEVVLLKLVVVLLGVVCVMLIQKK
jgi:hypothetical protein